ncbi:hypothetical protein [Dyadobacter tibetensis]|uniref:hypothetical protein n=1 Tax=Dyadobacter tibetensis TaxID=1211851 RepID=UPI000472F15E|nr:hypothetical protein [Dyadobacter tibetensis]
MKIEIKKKTQFQSEYTITRKDKSIELINLETKTYFLHDICHFVVEKNLQYSKGFWGMLSQGHSFKELFGKDNPQTNELRFIEQIVGPVQSVYWGHIPKQNFDEYIRHLDFIMTENILNSCLDEINSIMENWRQLSVGEQLIIEWKI